MDKVQVGPGIVMTKGPEENRALKTVIYGPEGIGKSTLASKFPDPVFIDTEGSTRGMDVIRITSAASRSGPQTWTELLMLVDSVRENPAVCKTLAIDTADWAEQLAIREFCHSKSIAGIEDIGYGKGYVYIAEMFGKLLNKLSDIVDKGTHVVLTAHAMMRKFEQPDEMGAYDRWELKLQKKTAALVKEWADLLLFANYKTFAVAVDKEGKKHKAQGGQRVMYTTHHPCWDAKNRLRLPDELPLDFAPLAPFFVCLEPQTKSKPEPKLEPEPKPEAKPEPKPEAKPDVEEVQPDSVPESFDAGPVPAVLEPMLLRDSVLEHEVREVIADRQGVFPMGTTWSVMENALDADGTNFIEGWVLPHWAEIVEIIHSSPDRKPF